METLGKHMTKKSAKHFAAMAMLELLKKDYETLKSKDIDPKTLSTGPSSNEDIQEQVNTAKTTPNVTTKQPGKNNNKNNKKNKKKIEEPASQYPYNQWSQVRNFFVAKGFYPCGF